MTDEQRTRVLQRVKARVRTSEPLQFRWNEDGTGECFIGPTGEEVGVTFAALSGPDAEDRLVHEICTEWADAGAEVLDEIRLTSDVAVVLDGHQFRIAELERAYTATPRERLDPSQPYSAEEAEADVERLARAIADYEPGGPWPDEAACVAAARKDASLLLSKLHGWKRGAPPSSPGHHHARSVFDGATLADAMKSDPPPAWTYTVEDAEADIDTAARALADFDPLDDSEIGAASVAASRCEAARMLLALTPWRAAVPVPSAGFVHVQQVAKRGEG